MTKNAYERTVDMFEALMGAPDRANHSTPGGLIQSSGLPASSGYRHLATLEAEGLLRRDESGTYLKGPSAFRIGLHGYCFGLFAPVVQPVLRQLRQGTQHSAFLAIVRDLTLHMGPHSVGRATQQTTLGLLYDIETIPEFPKGQVTELFIRSLENTMLRRTGVLLFPIAADTRQIVVIGLIMTAARGSNEGLKHALEHAGSQIASNPELM